MKKQKKQVTLKEGGITLVALVVTIIILLILAGVTINIALRENGLFQMARSGVNAYKEAQEEENQGFNKLAEEMSNFIGSGGSGGATGSIEIDGRIVNIAKGEIEQYYGRVVTNYKPEGTEDVSIDETTYTVSTTYRLYYVDFDNKYGDGAGTVYLKADVGPTDYALKTEDASSTSKIEKLNPGLYKDSEGKEIEPPSSSYNNMKAVTWLLDTAKWNGLVTSGEETEVGKKVNYVVGAPSLEMMMDSYNEHYGLMNLGTEPVAGEGDHFGNIRKKLFYKYTAGGYGYQVGPGYLSGYADWTANYTVQRDDAIGSMYYPTTGSSYTSYWLASPSSIESRNVRDVYGYGGGYVNDDYYDDAELRLCPLVSLQSDVILKLK